MTVSQSWNAEAAAQDAIVKRERGREGMARFIARSLDTIVVLMATYYIVNAVFGGMAVRNKVLMIAVAFALILVVEPLWLSTVAATPGKWIMGIRVLARDGERPAFAVALKRAAGAVTVGLGLLIPYVGYLTQIAAMQRLASKGETYWDQWAGTFVQRTPRPRLVWVLAITLVMMVSFFPLIAQVLRSRG